LKLNLGGWPGKLAFPFVAVFLVVFGLSRNVGASSVLTLLLFLLFAPLTVFVVYKNKMQSVHPFLKLSGVAACQLCGHRIERNMFTNSVFLLPYTFKTLRHYEIEHQELSREARRARIAGTLEVHALLAVFAGVFALGSLMGVRTLPLSLQVSAFLGAFLFIQLLGWVALYYVIVSKKGDLFGP
jgi:hypothetical protein